jgi:hypothetical protein
MGWASGSYLANDVWIKIRPFIAEVNRKKVAKAIYDKFCDSDADDWSDVDQLLVDMNSKK